MTYQSVRNTSEIIHLYWCSSISYFTYIHGIYSTIYDSYRLFTEMGKTEMMGLLSLLLCSPRVFSCKFFPPDWLLLCKFVPH